MNTIGYYIYGVIKKAKIKENIPGIDRKESIATIPVNDIACIISKVSLDEFGDAGLKKNLESLDWVKEKVIRHEQIIEEIMKTTTIIPMKFCTIFNSKNNILQLLNEKYGYFIELLDKFTDKHECGVKIYCKKKETAAVATAPSSGKEYLMLRKSQEEKSAEDWHKIDVFANEIFRKLKQIAEDVKINRITPKELIEDKNKEQILNISLLVSDNKMDELNVLSDGLLKTYIKEGLSIKITGPLPVYSFLEGDNNGNSK